MTTTIELIGKAKKLATETWINGEGLGGEVSETFTNLAQRLRELNKPDCVHTHDGEGNDNTACGHFIYMGSTGAKFCENCGGAVKEST